MKMKVKPIILTGIAMLTSFGCATTTTVVIDRFEPNNNTDFVQEIIQQYVEYYSCNEETIRYETWMPLPFITVTNVHCEKREIDN